MWKWKRVGKQSENPSAWREEERKEPVMSDLPFAFRALRLTNEAFCPQFPVYQEMRQAEVKPKEEASCTLRELQWEALLAFTPSFLWTANLVDCRLGVISSKYFGGVTYRDSSIFCGYCLWIVTTWIWLLPQFSQFESV